MITKRNKGYTFPEPITVKLNTYIDRADNESHYGFGEIQNHQKPVDEQYTGGLDPALTEYN